MKREPYTLHDILTVVFILMVVSIMVVSIIAVSFFFMQPPPKVSNGVILKDVMLSHLPECSMVIHKPGKDGGTFMLHLNNGNILVYDFPSHVIEAELFEANGFMYYYDEDGGWEVWSKRPKTEEELASEFKKAWP